MSWIYVPLTEGIIAQIVGYFFAFEMWNTLAQIYSSTFMARLTELHGKLQQIKKECLTAMEYIQEFKSICNNLAGMSLYLIMIT